MTLDSNHDPLCLRWQERDGTYECRCDLVAEVRADERERIAQAIEVCYFGEDAKAAVVDAYHRAARIARSSGY